MRAIIFDLDNCLAPASEVHESLVEPVFAAIRGANRGDVEPDALDAALRDFWVHAFDVVAERHGFTPAMRDAGWRAFSEIEVRAPMRGYGDLDVLPHLGDRRFLVTSGFRRLQESKVRALGIGAHFEELLVDAIEEPDRRGKEWLFVDLMTRHALPRDDVLVVGDNPDSELAAAERLGLRAVQILRPGVVRARATAHVADLAELRAMLDAWP
ncbi:HAD family hydrolase [Gemmatirosa kalamazoonensis]|uniref:HAD family hydrolase n=1 Tax=Gemmatirosa kalamazoonensis TaxID=861299 RepID=UPI00046D488B|nr:HAD family hydrolase [Gemmatirosa kalamazoonensis]